MADAEIFCLLLSTCALQTTWDVPDGYVSPASEPAAAAEEGGAELAGGALAAVDGGEQATSQAEECAIDEQGKGVQGEKEERGGGEVGGLDLSKPLSLKMTLKQPPVKKVGLTALESSSDIFPPALPCPAIPPSLDPPHHAATPPFIHDVVCCKHCKILIDSKLLTPPVHSCRRRLQALQNSD